MDEKNEAGAVEAEENLDLPEPEEGQEDSTDWKAEAQKLREKAIAQRERTKALKTQLAEAKAKVDSLPAPTQTQKPSSTNGLDETALDYLDVKGVTESEDIRVIEDVVKKTGMTVRQAFKDEYVTAKINANKAAREVKDATPSSTRRTGGNQGSDLSTLVAKYEQSGFDAKSLPDDFATRAKVINAVAAKQSTNKPGWH